jgi:hypothetical protein
MAVVTATFPSVSPTGEARPLAASAIWSIARDVRRQICGGRREMECRGTPEC